MRQRKKSVYVWDLIIVCLVTVGSAFSVSASEMTRLILIETMPVPAILEHAKWFRLQLEELGYTEGENFHLTVLEANGDRQLAEELLAAELAKGRPDLVVTLATLASQAAAKLLSGTDVPILFFQVADPVGAGLIKELHVASGTNITGKVYTVAREAKIEMIVRLARQVIPDRPIRLGFIHSSYPSSMGDAREFMQIDRDRDDIVLVPYTIEYQKVPAGLAAMLEEAQDALCTLEGKVDFWLEPLGPLGETPEFTQFLLEHSEIPIMLGTKLESVKMGALMYVSPNVEAGGREVAVLADKLLKGAAPGKIPVVPPAKFDLGVNLTTAMQLGIVIPPDMLDMAGEHVYR